MHVFQSCPIRYYKSTDEGNHSPKLKTTSLTLNFSFEENDGYHVMLTGLEIMKNQKRAFDILSVYSNFLKFRFLNRFWGVLNENRLYNFGIPTEEITPTLKRRKYQRTHKEHQYEDVFYFKKSRHLCLYSPHIKECLQLSWVDSDWCILKGWIYVCRTVRHKMEL